MLVVCCITTAVFCPGYKESDDSEKVIMEPGLIAIQVRWAELENEEMTNYISVQYVKSWFWLDILSSIPVDYLFLILDSGILDTEEVKLH